MHKWQAYILIITGTAGIMAGAALTSMYVWAAVIDRIGEPDQSLLFWYLPLLFLGLLSGGGGVALLFWGISRLKKT